MSIKIYQLVCYSLLHIIQIQSQAVNPPNSDKKQGEFWEEGLKKFNSRRWGSLLPVYDRLTGCNILEPYETPSGRKLTSGAEIKIKKNC
jgi:hypothetical protein